MSSRISFGKHSLMKQVVSVAVVCAMVMTTAPGLIAAASDPVTAVGSLSIASDPAGAAVYVDGAFAGRTPLSVDKMSAGDHRVRVVKDGYLENGRVVSISAGAAKNVDVKLTQYSGTTTAASAAPAAAAGGGSLFTNPIFLAAVGGGVVAAVFLLKGGKPPVAGTVVASVTTAIASAGVTFTAQGASDPGNKTLTYAWDFGDGSTSTTVSPTHAFASAGTFNVKVTVNNGSKTASATLPLTVKTLTATWHGAIPTFGLSTTVVINQSGNAISGTYVDGLNGGTTGGTIAGVVTTNTPRVTFTVTIPGIAPFVFTGEPGADGNSLIGVANGSGLVNASWTLTRG